MLLSVLNRKCGLICAFRKDSSAFSFSFAISLACCSDLSHWLITFIPVLRTKTSRKITRLKGLSSGGRGRGGRSEPGRREAPKVAGRSGAPDTAGGPNWPEPAERLV